MKKYKYMSKILIEKNRPNEIKDMLLTNNIKNLYKNIIKNNKVPNLLLYGSFGTGKTTFINIVYKRLNYDALVINGSLQRDNKMITNIKDYIYSKNLNKNKKIVIIDEADSIPKNIQIELRLLIKNNKNITFCLMCNYINKIIEEIKTLLLDINFNINEIEESTIKKYMMEKYNIKIKKSNIINKNIDMRTLIHEKEIIKSNRKINKYTSDILSNLNNNYYYIK